MTQTTETLPTERPNAPTAPPSEGEVLHANRVVYNRKTLAEYDQNESIFTPERQAEIERVLSELAERAPGGRFVDVGCGTGNLLRLALPYFSEAIGIDQAEKLLAQVKEKNPAWRVLSGQSHRLPFADGSVDAVGMYALLHHLKDPEPTLAEAARVLAPGGMLYTDHDPNRAFWRFHGMWGKVTRVGRRQSFGTDLEDMAEYHHVYSNGLDPKALARQLRELGFINVSVRYRQTVNPTLKGLRGGVAKTLRVAGKVMPARSLFTHFQIVAERGASEGSES